MATMAKKAAKAKTTKAKPKAKGKAKADAAEQKTTAATASDLAQVINDKKLRALLSSDNRIKEDIDGFTSQLRTEIKTAVDKDFLDKEVYAIVKKFSRWTGEKLADKWPLILLYMDKLGLMKRIDDVTAAAEAEAPHLPLDGEDDDDGPQAGDGGQKPGPVLTDKQLADAATATEH